MLLGGGGGDDLQMDLDYVCFSMPRGGTALHPGREYNTLCTLMST